MIIETTIPDYFDLRTLVGLSHDVALVVKLLVIIYILATIMDKLAVSVRGLN